MEIKEIYQEIDQHQIEGLMHHYEWADMFRFLNLNGFANIQEIQHDKEGKSNRDLHNRYIKHQHALIPASVPNTASEIPATWYSVNVADVDRSIKQDAVRTIFDKWYQWEMSTLTILQDLYKQCLEMGYIAECEYIEEMIEDVDKEQKKAYWWKSRLKDAGYDMNVIYDLQDEVAIC